MIQIGTMHHVTAPTSDSAERITQCTAPQRPPTRTPTGPVIKIPSSGPRFAEDSTIGPMNPPANEIEPMIAAHLATEARRPDVLVFMGCEAYQRFACATPTNKPDLRSE